VTRSYALQIKFACSNEGKDENLIDGYHHTAAVTFLYLAVVAAMRTIMTKTTPSEIIGESEEAETEDEARMKDARLSSRC
jgi:hypothetical protein